MRQQRRGAILVGIITCILVIMSLLGLTIKATLSDMRGQRNEFQSRQADWLLKAAMLRADRVRTDASYDGEEWRVPEGVLPLGEAIASIQIERASEELASVSISLLLGDESDPTAVRRELNYQIEIQPN